MITEQQEHDEMIKTIKFFVELEGKYSRDEMYSIIANAIAVHLCLSTKDGHEHDM